VQARVKGEGSTGAASMLAAGSVGNDSVLTWVARGHTQETMVLVWFDSCRKCSAVRYLAWVLVTTWVWAAPQPVLE